MELERLLDVKYFGDTQVVLKRVFPPSANFCKVSTYTNAINYLTHVEIKPEEVLDIINLIRKQKGLVPLDLYTQSVVVPFKDLERALRVLKLVKVKRVQGREFMNRGLWKDLMSSGMVFGSYHQQVYTPDNEFTLKYLPAKLAMNLIDGSRFSYKNFYELYGHIYKHLGTTDLGHTELILDIKKVDGYDHVILANLDSRAPNFYIKLPWNFYAKYLAWDWLGPDYVSPEDSLPRKKVLRSMKFDGWTDDGTLNFVYGLLDIFYLEKQEDTLARLLSSHSKSFTNIIHSNPRID